MNKTAGKLFLLPTWLGEENNPDYLCGKELSLIQDLKFYLAENEKSARRFLRKAGFKGSFDEIQILRLDKDTPPEKQSIFIDIIRKGENAGILSDAGMPAIADPGANFIRLAHIHNINVIPVPGPSSILLAIMGSGLNGQQFSFNGYLPVDKKERLKKIIALDEISFRTGYAQFFIETPYRNESLYNDLLKGCNPGTDLCIAANLTQSDSWIKTQRICDWVNQQPELHKIPVVFGILRRH